MNDYEFESVCGQDCVEETEAFFFYTMNDVIECAQMMGEDHFRHKIEVNYPELLKLFCGGR